MGRRGRSVLEGSLMTAREVVELIHQNVGVPWNSQSHRDIFKIGDPDTKVTGIATTMMTNFDVIKRAHAAGLNLIVTHEDIFWNDPDDTTGLTDNPLYKLKTKYCLDNGMVVWRFHDHLHARTPDMCIAASLRSIGVEGGEDATMRGGRVYTIPPTTLGAFASQIKRLTGSRAFRVVGDPNAKVSRILLGPGYAFPRMTAEADVVIGGEQQETDGFFDDAEYVLDAASLGIPKGQIILGHVVSEEPGMKDCAEWLRTFVKGVPIEFVPAGEPYWT
jgi:putative NIF3 family GTP cyclohydrolase 1 type 2